MPRLILAASVLVLCACQPAPSTNQPGQPASTASRTPAASTPESAAAVESASAGAPDNVPAFAGKVWRVRSSPAGEVGSTYAFLPDGTLVIDSPHGTPMRGQWTYEDGKLVMTEEGVAYPTDILRLDAATFEVRSHNPGGSVDIKLVPAPEVALPVE